MFIKKIYYKIYYIAVLITFLLQSCDREVTYALESAKGNREELEKVLKYFKNDSDNLKYKAACFLIKNMPYHYSYTGKSVDTYDSIYMRMAMEPKQFRDSVFNDLIKRVDFRDKEIQWDIETLNAELLITAIEYACDTWKNVSWNKNYDNQFFFDYVLPYRILNEQPSNWHETIDKEYPYLKSNAVWSKRGIWIEAEEATPHNAHKMYFGNAYNDSVVMLDNPSAMVTFCIHSSIPSKKNLYLRYSSIGTNRIVDISVNGKKIKHLRLDPTKSMTVFRLNRTEVEIALRKGFNKIAVKYNNGNVGLDYMQLITVEEFNDTNEKDFTTDFFRIKNKNTGNYITFSTNSDTILLDDKNTSDSLSILKINYCGYACWSITSAKNNDNCLTTDNWFVKEHVPITQSKYQNKDYQKWVFIPTKNGCYKIMGKDSGLFLGTKSDNKGKETLIQSSYSEQDSQHWEIEPQGRVCHNTSCYTQGSAIAKAFKITDVMPQFEWFSFQGDITPKASSLCKARTGICRDEANYTVYLCRHMGIPATVDFTPHWGNRSRGHQWCVLIKPDGTSMPFYMGHTPGDTIHEYHNYIKPKVFRHNFRLNRTIANDLKEEMDIPQLFQIPNFTDVTNEYLTTSDIVRNIPKELSDKRIAYICVSEKSHWIPVHYGKISQGKVIFKSMGRNIVYMSALSKDGKMIPFGNPFFVDKNGITHDIKADEVHKQDMYLLRKHPFLRINDRINNFMSGGKFQASNTPDFSKTVDLYIHRGITTGNWYNVKIGDRNTYKYLRYIGPNGAYCNINELQFFDSEENLISGKIIGTDGEKGMEKDKVFDNDILTTFQGLDRSGHWVGLKLHYPTQVSRIRYIPRNDGNCIEAGNRYELFYWENNGWKSLGNKIAQSDTLTYKNVPSRGLYLLHNHTKGVEERIFTYENNKQVWW